MYYPLQFFTILQGTATITSLVKVGAAIFPEVRIVLILATLCCFVFGWLYWFLLSGEALRCKAGAGAIAIGALLGLWL